MATPSGVYEANVNITLGIWVRRSGAWTKLTQVYAYYYASKATAGNANYTANYSGSLQLGNGIEAFGVTVDGIDNGTVTGVRLDQVRWTSQASSGGTRTALPNGATTTITVRPK